MFARGDFWIGLVVGTLVGAFGYKMITEQRAMMALPAQAPSAARNMSVEELLRQKEQLEDLIAEQQSATA